jgi:hypothetical protein
VDSNLPYCIVQSNKVSRNIHVLEDNIYIYIYIYIYISPRILVELRVRLNAN